MYIEFGLNYVFSISCILLFLKKFVEFNLVKSKQIFKRENFLKMTN